MYSGECIGDTPGKESNIDIHTINTHLENM